MRKFLIGFLFLVAITTIIYSCQDAGKIKQDVYYVNGRDLYIKHCQNCHGVNGEGLGKLTPPLTDTLFLKANKQQIACFIKNGVNSPITVSGQVYEGTMPGFPTLANIDMAQLVVYVTNSFGNKQGMYTQDDIAKDLKNCP